MGVSCAKLLFVTGNRGLPVKPDKRDIMKQKQGTFMVISVLIILCSLIAVFGLGKGIKGADKMRDCTFSLPMFFGLGSGCYSSICIAGTLWAMWMNWKEKKVK